MALFIRNPEVKYSLLLYIILSAVFLATGYFLAPAFMVPAAVFCVLFIAIYLVTTGRRYMRLRKLALELDRMLHFQTPIPFDQYREGELSILQSELSKMTTRLVAQAEQLTKDKTYLSDAMADISHQLRSPLTSSELIVTLLREPELTFPRRMELLQELSQLLSRINWLIETLLKMSKMDAKTAYLKKENILISTLLQNAAEPLLIPMELHGHNLSIHQSSPCDSFTGDLAWTTEAILNILKNCMEHIPENGQIEIFSKENELFTELRIEDNGPGFLPEDLPRIFERFYKGHGSGSQSVGIGLALARMIIVEQNGTIRAENLREGGAAFTIRFYKGTV